MNTLLQPRDYQDKCELSLWDYFASKSGNPLVCLPTGTGKSIVIALFIHRVMQRYPNSRILVMTHVKELLVQNSGKLELVWPTAPYGIFSSGLRRKDVGLPIIFGGVASVVGAVDELGWFDLVVVDEAHLMSGKDDSMYGEIVNKLKAKNPHIKVVGLTATPYRTGQGLLTQNGLFTDIAIDLTTMKWFNWFIDNGYMCPMYPKRTDTKLDVSKVRIVQGEFDKKQLEAAIDVRDINYLACKESVEYGSDRQCWLTFASSIPHAEHLAEMFNNFGIKSVALHSKLKEKQRDKIIAAYKAGEIRNIVNKGIFTTGQDHPPIDFIVDLNPTCSTGLHVQKYGRGSRPSPGTGKQDCLCLDFAGNVSRLGPINDPLIPRKRGSGAPGVAPIRICDECGTYNHASARNCFKCGAEFPHQIHIQATAGTNAIVRDDAPVIQQFKVDRALYSKFVSNGINILRVNYVCGVKAFSEVVCLEHPGRAGSNAVDWWLKRMGSKSAPPTVDEALLWVSKLAVPTLLHVDVNKKYPKIIKAEFA